MVMGGTEVNNGMINATGSTNSVPKLYWSRVITNQQAGQNWYEG